MLLLPVVGSSQFWTLALVAVWGLAYGAMPIALQMWMVNAAPEMHEAGMALFVANFQISIAVGSVLGGTVADLFGVPRAFFAAAVLCMVALPILLVSRADSERV